MKLAPATLAALGSSLVLAACATAPQPEAHAAHHPPTASAPASADASHQPMDAMMKSMQEKHRQLMAAKTPEERARLRQEHMKAMHDGMAMMRRMHGDPSGMGGMKGGKPMNPEMMGKCMAMMDLMMKMMVEREAQTPATTP